MSKKKQGRTAVQAFPDVDLERGMVTVRHTLARTKEGLVLQSPKTRKSKRVVFLPPFVVQSLREHKQFQVEERAQHSWGDNGTSCSPQDSGPRSMAPT